MIDAVLRSAENLNAMLAEENAALTALDLPRAVALLAAKQSAVAAFMMARDVAEPAALDRTARQAAEPIFRRLTALAEENRALLRRAIDVQARVLGTIARAMPHAAMRGGSGYGAQGRLAQGTGRPTAIAVCARA